MSGFERTERRTGFLELKGYTGAPVWLAVANICALCASHNHDSKTVVYLVGTGTWEVKETVGEILEMLRSK